MTIMAQTIWEKLQKKNVNPAPLDPIPDQLSNKEQNNESNNIITMNNTNKYVPYKKDEKENLKEETKPEVKQQKPKEDIDFKKSLEMKKRKKDLLKYKNIIQKKLIDEFSVEDIKMERSDVISFEKTKEDMKSKIEKMIEDFKLPLTKDDKDLLTTMILDDIIGFGPIQPLIDSDKISEIMVNGLEQVYIEKKGKLVLVPEIFFESNEQALKVADKILSPLNRRVDESNPYVDARLPDGSRVNIIIPPLAIKGPTFTIRKFSKDPLMIDDLVRFGSLTKEMADFLKACVEARINIVVSGGTGSGKTTMLNILSSFIPEDERIITIEDAAELQLRQPHVVSLEARPAGISGTGEVTIRDLVKNSLRMRPDRIVVGECRGGEALDMLQAMNTGHDGSMTTAHANSSRDMLNRLETMVLMSGMNLPVKAIREQISSAIQLVIQQKRLQDGSRKITEITEVKGMEGETIVTQKIFEFQQEGVIVENGKRKVIGKFVPQNCIPSFYERFAEMGIEVSKNIFFNSKR